MDWSFLRYVADLSSAAAVIVVVKLFLDHESRERDKDRSLWSNHLSQVVEELHEVAVKLEVLSDALLKR